ncbi:MAG: hybrid sensor histidine kinase/response regulator [Verrucomicrobiota bacterium]|nr:hybrid sensor histidine kinase/response regulator [Verrucomicrobiota bacterium]
MKKILVIDDEEWLREMVHMALRQKGYEVVEAGNGADGIEIARKELPDLILCDINMQKVDGYLTLSSLRNESPTAAIPFILMTGLADNAGMRHGMELGADDYLAKPFTTDDLYAAVEARLKKAQAVREEAERKLATLRDNISLMLPHELRTPLNGILAYGEILTEDAPSLKTDDIVEMGRVIHQSGKRLERLIENFLIYAQLEMVAADPQSVSALRIGRTGHAAPLVEKRATAQAALANRSQDLTSELADVAVPMVEEYLGKIVDELTQNAFKFSKAGSPVTVQLSETSNTVILTFSDRGRGFSSEQASRVGAYMQFDRKMHEQQGLGLGLTIAKRLVELHGGSLAIEGQKDVGATIIVKLPQPKPDETAPAD